MVLAICAAEACLVFACSGPSPILEDAGQDDAGAHADSGVDSGAADAGSDDAGPLVDSGADAGADAAVADAGGEETDGSVPDAGTPDAGMCPGCFAAGGCQPGNLPGGCGTGGAPCATCGAPEVCALRTCTTPPPAIDLIAEDIQVSDVLDEPAALSFRVTATIRNIGLQPAGVSRWAAVLSEDATYNLLSDEIVVDGPVAVLPPLSSVIVTERVTISAPLILQSPTLYVFAIADASNEVAEAVEVNNAGLSARFNGNGQPCAAQNCSGCCATNGCVIAAKQGVAACGAAGSACLACVAPQVCVSGACQ